MVGKKCRNKSYEYAITMEKKETRPYKKIQKREIEEEKRNTMVCTA